MGKTFEEWYAEVNKHEELEDKVYVVGMYHDDDYFSYSEFELALKAAWDASRQNMTYKDI